jgi:hypothetical protein
MRIIISPEFQKEAEDYAMSSRAFTSDRHDFHEGGLSAKQRKMFEGKLGEKAIKQLFIDNNILFDEDKTSFDEEDFFDFLVWVDKTGQELKVDVKTRTKDFHTRTLEMVEQMKKKPKDIYISVRLFNKIPYEVEILGFGFKHDFLTKNPIENQGYLDNYVLYDKDLRSITNMLDNLKKK